MIKGKQIAAARTLLGWTRYDLEEHSGISAATIKNIEVQGTQNPRINTLNPIVEAFSRNGVEFIEGGLRERQDFIRILQGSNGFEAFLDDVYNTAIENGTSKNPCQIFLSNVVHENWTKWMPPEKWKDHVNRMIMDKSVMDVRIIVCEGDLNFPAKEYAQYKWVPQERFRSKSFYSYIDKLAFLDFKNDDVIITIIRQSDFAEGYRNHFLDTWDFLAKKPSE